MRITTQMLDASMKKAGLNFQRTSLLDFINQKNGENSLLSSLGSSAVNKYSSLYNSNVGKVGAVNSNSYKKIGKAADNLAESSAKLLKTKDSIFEKENNSREVYDSVEDFIEDYNSTISSLKDTTSPLNSYYMQMLKEAASENKDSLSQIGITVNSKGMLSVNREILEKSAPETVNQVLGNKSKFTNKVNFISQRVSSNASANLESVGGQYSSFGEYYSAYSKNKFDSFM